MREKRWMKREKERNKRKEKSKEIEKEKGEEKEGGKLREKRGEREVGRMHCKMCLQFTFATSGLISLSCTC